MNLSITLFTLSIVLIFVFASGCGNTSSLTDNNITKEVILTAKIKRTPIDPKQGDEIRLDATSSTISHGKITSYQWSEYGKILSTHSIYKHIFPAGEHNVSLLIKDSKGHQALSYDTFVVTPSQSSGRWDNINPTTISADKKRKLFVTSDTDNLYIKVVSDQNVTQTEIYIDSDNSNLSGLYSSYWDEGFDYILKPSGLFALKTGDQYQATLIQSLTYNVEQNYIEVTLDKKLFPYLAKEIAMVVQFKGEEKLTFPEDKPVPRYNDPYYDETQPDTIAPIIKLNGDPVISIPLNTTYQDPGAKAIDVVDGDVTDTLEINTSKLKTTIAGYYTIYYSAQDHAGNTAQTARIVQVTSDNDTRTALEVKTLGIEKDGVVINHQTGLVWDDDGRDETTTRGCIIFGENRKENPDQMKSDLKKFCEQLQYAGFSDWRVPTSLELSKFYVQMVQEGKTPRMARKGCIRNIAIDTDGSLKSVWTHIKPQPGFIEKSPLSPSGGRCVRGPIDSDTGNFKLKTIGSDLAKVIIDQNNNLMWVNDNDKNSKACLAIHTQNDLDNAQNFCSTLRYGGFDDWRNPTPKELSNFIKETTNTYLLPGYKAPCKRLLAKSADGNYSAVSTRFDTTKELGTISLLEYPLSFSIGLRCVRTNP